MFRLIIQINSYIWKISRSIDKKYAWIFHIVIWMTIIFLLFYILLNLIAIWIIFLVVLLLSLLLKSLYEYIKEKWCKKTSISILILWIFFITSLLSVSIYNYPKLNNWIIEKSKTISESIPLSKRWVIKDVKQWVNNSQENQNTTNEVTVESGWLEIESNN